MMTEDEAKTKWCPMVRITAFIDGDNCAWSVNNRGQWIAEEERIPRECLSSECALWKQSKYGTENGCCGLSSEQS